MRPLLQVADLRMSLRIDDREVVLLDGVSFTVASGEAVGIVGESGSGKSLTLGSMVGLRPPRATLSGEVTFDERSVLELSERELRQHRSDDVGMVFQDPHAAINPVHRVVDFLTEPYPRRERAAAAAKAATLLQQVQITDPARVLRCYPHQLSGGMLQRVVIASVLMRDPRLILADEPTTALDVTTQAEVVALLDKARLDGGASLLLVSHDIELVAAVCDRIVVMYAGAVVEQLTPAQLHAGQIAEPYTRALLASRPDITRRQHRLPVVPFPALEKRHPA